VPFDKPEAETEIVAVTFTEYSGRLHAIFRMAIDVEMIVVSALLAAVFLPLYITDNALIGFALYVAKTLFIVFILSAIRSTMARLRIEQMVNFCWKILTPMAILQIVIDLVIKGVFIK
jgi:NADH-quinone oxidoreductase subunit H